MERIILAIDPGDKISGYVAWDGIGILEKGIAENLTLLHNIISGRNYDLLALENVASYGMAVGQNVFDTCFWIGRFYEKSLSDGHDVIKIFRKDIKTHICGTNKANDTNVKTALIDRFGDRQKHGKDAKGTKKNPGFFYGVKEDIWQAFAVAVYAYDNYKFIT